MKPCHDCALKLFLLRTLCVSDLHPYHRYQHTQAAAKLYTSALHPTVGMHVASCKAYYGPQSLQPHLLHQPLILRVDGHNVIRAGHPILAC